jgi:hypothetical protein
MGRRKAADEAAAAAAALAAIPYVAPPWGAKETQVLMMLCEREGLGSWARKALQLGGRRTAEDLNTRYFWVLRQRKEADEKKEAEEEAVRAADALVEAEAKAERSRLVRSWSHSLASLFVRVFLDSFSVDSGAIQTTAEGAC